MACCRLVGMKIVFAVIASLLVAGCGPDSSKNAGKTATLEEQQTVLTELEGQTRGHKGNGGEL